MKFENVQVFNFEGALRGMRNPLESWQRSDSNFEKLELGENDLKLAQRLLRAGSEHAKFARQIMIGVDITGPLYWWKEMDTYKVGTVANSTSTMHKLISKPFTKEMFSFDGNLPLFDEVIGACEDLRKVYLETKDPTYWRALVQILPNAFNQTRTWTANYAVLRNIYFQRRDHKLKEWHEFCDWIATLPYAKELIMLEDKNETD